VIKNHSKSIDRYLDVYNAQYAHSILVHVSNLLNICVCTGWPKKVSHYQVSSLNHIKTVIKAANFDYKMSTRL